MVTATDTFVADVVCRITALFLAVLNVPTATLRMVNLTVFLARHLQGPFPRLAPTVVPPRRSLSPPFKRLLLAGRCLGWRSLATSKSPTVRR